MSRLTARAQTSITVNGKEYPLNTSFRNALKTWDALEAGSKREISPISAAYAAIWNMLGIKLEDFNDEDIDTALREIAFYLQNYSRVPGSEEKEQKPCLDIELDAVFLFDAFVSMGVDLDSQNISYPRFMSLLRELPKEATICRIIYLRQQNQKGKLTAEERAECGRRGWDVIKMQDKSNLAHDTNFEAFLLGK